MDNQAFSHSEVFPEDVAPKEELKTFIATTTVRTVFKYEIKAHSEAEVREIQEGNYSPIKPSKTLAGRMPHLEFENKVKFKYKRVEEPSKEVE